MNIHHVEALFWNSAGKADRYRSQDSEILASDRFVKKDGTEERNGTNTFLLKTNTAGAYWAATFCSDGTHTARKLTEQEAVNMWAEMEAWSQEVENSGGTRSTDMVTWADAFGFPITDV